MERKRVAALYCVFAAEDFEVAWIINIAAFIGEMMMQRQVLKNVGASSSISGIKTSTFALELALFIKSRQVVPCVQSGNPSFQTNPIRKIGHIKA